MFRNVLYTIFIPYTTTFKIKTLKALGAAVSVILNNIYSKSLASIIKA